MACLINGYDSASIDRLVVVEAPESIAGPSSGPAWRLIIEGRDALRFELRNPRWAYTPTSDEEEDYRTEETEWFHVMAGRQKVQARLSDFQTISLTHSSRNIVYAQAQVALTAPNGKQTTGRMTIGDQKLSRRMSLFADTPDGIGVAISHATPMPLDSKAPAASGSSPKGWTLTSVKQD